MSLSTINLIDSDIRRNSTAAGLDGSPEASQKLARDIAARIKNGKINIRIVIRGDNLGRIAEVLSRGEIKSTDEGGAGWGNIPVKYLGPSPRIQQQKEYNPACTLIQARRYSSTNFNSFKISHGEIMSALTDIVNEINDVVKIIPPGGSAWDSAVTQKFAIDLAARVDPLKINIRKVQPKDNMIPIVVGLSRSALLPKSRGGNGSLESLPITYLGDSEQIQKEKDGNKEQLAVKANLIEVGQYIALNKDMSGVFIADNIQQILTALVR